MTQQTSVDSIWMYLVANGLLGSSHLSYTSYLELELFNHSLHSLEIDCVKVYRGNLISSSLP